MKRTALFLLTLAVTTSGFAAEPTFKELLSGKTVPLTLKLKDLNQEWRRFGGVGRSGYYTKGETVTTSGETFFIAYRMENKAADYQMLMQRRAAGQPQPEVEKPTPETLLTLSLLNARSISLTDIRPFDLEAELAGGDTSPAAREEARDRAAKAVNLGNLRKIGVALLTYVQDGDKTLPPLHDSAAAQKALAPYGAKDAFDQPYEPNASLAGKKPSEIVKPAETVAFYESKPQADGRGILFLDGHVERVTESRWQELKKASGIR